MDKPIQNFAKRERFSNFDFKTRHNREILQNIYFIFVIVVTVVSSISMRFQDDDGFYFMKIINTFASYRFSYYLIITNSNLIRGENAKD